MHRESVPAQFVRFALVGLGSWVVFVAVFLALSPIGPMLANVVATTLSTVLANELHRRVTFHANARSSWVKAQVEGGLLSLTAIAATSLGLALLLQVRPDASGWVQVLAVTVITAVLGALRFIALRRYVFQRGQDLRAWEAWCSEQGFHPLAARRQHADSWIKQVAELIPPAPGRAAAKDHR